MKKVIIRKNHCVNIMSRYIFKIGGGNYDVKQLEKQIGLDALLQCCYDESLSYKELLTIYKNFEKTNLNNDYFEYIYDLNNTFGLKFNEESHFFQLYHFEKTNDEIKNEDIIPWKYASGLSFFGRYNDKITEVIRDINSLSMMDFVLKYNIQNDDNS